MFYWLMKRVFAGPWLKLFFRPWTRGVENVPAEGGAILASNHLAVIDSFVLPLVLDREIVFIGKSEYFTGTGIKGRLQAGFFRGVGTIPVDRSGGKAKLGVKLIALAALKVPAWEADKLPPHLAGTKPVKPGSRGLA